MQILADADLERMLEDELAEFEALIRAQRPSEALAKLRVYAELTEKLDAQSIYALTHRLLN